MSADEEKPLETLDDLNETLNELMDLGLIQAWPSRETRYAVKPDVRQN